MNDAQQQDSQEAAGDCRIPSPFQKKTCWYALTGVAIGLTYKKSMREAVEIGTRLAASVITASENVCPRFRPRELGLDVEVES